MKLFSAKAFAVAAVNADMGLSAVVRAEPKIDTFRTSLYGANIVNARLISSMAALAILISKDDDGPLTSSVTVVMNRFN